MKLFQLIKKSLKVVGISPTQTPVESSFNWKNKIISTFLSFCSIFATLFLLIEAKILTEYSESFYLTITVPVMVLFVVELTRKVFKMIDDFESVIEKR